MAVNTISRAEKKLNLYRSTSYNTRKSETLGTVNGEGDGLSSARSGEVVGDKNEFRIGKRRRFEHTRFEQNKHSCIQENFTHTRIRNIAHTSTFF